MSDMIGRVAVIRVLLFLLFIPCLPSQLFAADGPVLPGIDVLEQRGFDLLQGKRVGLITNHTGRSRDGRSTIDIINRAPGCRLTALFSPEHGIRGEADEKVASATDRASGLPVHSLYGATCRPTPDMLHGVDILVFDIQDIGTRFYTYIGTLSLAMRAARDAGIPFVVLDRPNPLGGERVEGAIPTTALPERASGCGAITSIHPIPTRHGMTMGELARLFNTEFGIGCRLTVVPMQGWRRSMYFDATGLTWINPSPNMKSLPAAILYPGLGTLETADLSVGRGTERPFLAYGAPWADGAAVARNLAGRSIPGISFTPCSFVPTAAGHPYRGKRCSGVCVAALDRDRLDPVLAGLHLAQAFYETHPRQFKVSEGFGTEVGDREAWRLLKQKGVTPLDVVRRWDEDLERFRKVRGRYLLY
ncbi:DUF1343 domain-containing protein [Oryzomonas rubra]|uniref:DUF1343 domain-containing protein n=2 Tax=Oryzomonas rubra TaxID=2509454 RepID=A0A5A9XGB7_9BACT|nr:DUF1343 domain-containing protein [Oryzomonas rubra]